MPISDAADLIDIVNPTSGDFSVEYGKVPHSIKSGEQRTFQRYLANHIIKHLTNREIMASSRSFRGTQKKDKPTLTNENLRREWFNKIYIGVRQYHRGDEAYTSDEQALAKDKAFKDALVELQNLKDEVQAMKSTPQQPTPPPPVPTPNEPPKEPTPRQTWGGLSWPKFRAQARAKDMTVEEITVAWKQWKADNPNEQDKQAEPVPVS